MVRVPYVPQRRKLMKSKNSFNDLTDEQLAIMFNFSKHTGISGEVLVKYKDEIDFTKPEDITEEEFTKLYLEDLAYNYNKMQVLIITNNL